MDYTHLSDFEINKLVESALRPGWQESDYRMPKEYCNNPADAWTVIQVNGISIVKHGHGMWLASSDAYWVDGVEWQIDGENHPNPLRAAMIVFLMMQESANVQDNPAR